MKIKRKQIGDDDFIFFTTENDSPHDPLHYGYIQYYISWNENQVQLLYIYVHPEYRGNHYGEYLIKKMFEDVITKMKKRNIHQIEIYLDDMSDKFAKEDNLYRKMGFQYCEVDEEGPCGPEMSMTIRR
jgi:ribosomal protein S18 acetylase RimI-like enzyme